MYSFGVHTVGDPRQCLEGNAPPPSYFTEQMVMKICQKSRVDLYQVSFLTHKLSFKLMAKEIEPS